MYRVISALSALTLLVACAGPSEMLRAPGATAAQVSGIRRSVEDDGGRNGRRVVLHSPVLGVALTYLRPSTYTKGIDPIYDAASVIAKPTPARRTKHKLFLFLGGTKTVPKMYQYFIAVAALHGFNAIALEYPDIPRIGNLCATSKDPNCWGDVRYEVFTGQNTSSLVDVNRTNSISQRLADLLAHLTATDPRGGWSDFRRGGKLAWNTIEVGGHSQGGGDAAFIGKYQQLNGNCSIESMVDGDAFVPTAAWLSMPGKTSPQVGYGFANELDNFIDFGTMVLDWTTLEFAGPQINVDTVKPPYFRSHQLFTSKQFAAPLNSHDYTSMDYITPLDARGFPAFAPVWSYVCGFGT